MSESYRPYRNYNFKAEDAVITVVVRIPDNKVNITSMLISTYTSPGTLPPELIDILEQVQKGLPK